MQFTAKDFGYTLYSRIEDALRSWLTDRLQTLFGDRWKDQIPLGVWIEVQDHCPMVLQQSTADPADLLDNTYLSHLSQIVCYKGGYALFFPESRLDQAAFQEAFSLLNSIRAKVAHVRRSFSHFDLEQLITLARTFSALLGDHAHTLVDTLQSFDSDPTPYAIKIPAEFILGTDSENAFQHLNNLPPADYDMDGGFVGRKEDLKTFRKFLTGNLYRVVTIAGAGGVGKTALAHQLCESFLSVPNCCFDAVVWMSAKEEQLTVSGIEALSPQLKSHEDLLDAILKVLVGDDLPYVTPTAKHEAADAALQMCDKGILLVIDNLETIGDADIIEYIKEFPPPHRVLITSRLGLGEIEKRRSLKALTDSEALTLFRSLAREKQLYSLAANSDDTLLPYIRKTCSFPLAMKWAIGQVVIGRDINTVTAELAAPESQIAVFTFDTIYSKHLDDADRVVLSALSTDDAAMTKGVLCHLANFTPVAVDRILLKLTQASLVIPTISKTARGDLETRYELLSLTREYIFSKLQADTVLYARIKERISVVQHMLTEANKAERSSNALRNELPAITEEEKIAVMWVRSARERYDAGQYEAAVKMYERASAFAPRFPGVYRSWALTESAEGRYERASELMAKAVQLDSTSPALWLSSGLIQMRWGHYDAAAEQLKKALELAPENYEVIGALADVKRRHGDYEESEGLFNRALKVMEPKGIHGKALMSVMTSRADNLRRWAEELASMGKRAEASRRLISALEVANAAIAAYPSDSVLQSLRREISLQLGHVTLHISGINGARVYFDQAIVWNPIRERDKRVTEFASITVADYLLREEPTKDSAREAARKYIDVCKKVVKPRTTNAALLDELAMEYTHKRLVGQLEHVVLDQGYGFVKVGNVDMPQVLLHRTALLPTCSKEQFDRLQGRRLSFFVTEGTKGPRGKRAVLLPDA